MAYRNREIQYPVNLDREDLQFRMWAALAASGYTIADFADYMGISRQYALDAMGGIRYMLSVEFLVNLCAFTGCTLTDILPFANSELPVPYRRWVTGGGPVVPIPYIINISEPEVLGDDGWKTNAPQNEV